MSARGRLRAAAALMLVQGVLMEGGVFIGLLVLQLLGIDQAEATERFSFALGYLQDNLYQVMVMSGIFGAMRIAGAVGVLRNRMWGMVLSLINCTVTLVLMLFILPAGIADGLLSGTALVLLLHTWYGTTPIHPTDGEKRPSA